MSILDPLAITSAAELFLNDADGFRAATFDEVIAGARTAIGRRFQRGIELKTPALVRDFLRLHFADQDREIFLLVLVDTQNRLIAVEEIAQGTINAASVYPREVVACVLRHHAAGVLLSHNHPSGVAEPSGADRLLTDRLRTALSTIDVRLIDHLVVGADTVTSFAERGWI
jgi:DNA repair protein RadC